MLQATQRKQRLFNLEWLYLAAAVIVPCAALGVPIVSAGELGVAGPGYPFGFARVVLVSTLAAVPLCWLLARRAARWSDQPFLVLAVTMGLVLAALSLVLRPLIAEELEHSTPAVRSGARVVWPFLLQLPWLYAFVRSGGTAAVARTKWDGGLVLVTAVLILVAIPHVYVVSVCERQGKVVEHYWRNHQFLAAWRLTERMAPLDPRVPIRNRAFAQARQQIAVQVWRCQEGAGQPLPADATPAQHVDRAEQWFGLGEWDRAEQLVTDLVPQNPRASLLKAMLDELRGDYRGVVQHSQLTAQLVKAEVGNDPPAPEQRELLMQAYKRWVNNLRRLRESPHAEAVLRQAMDQWPVLRGELLFELAVHYRMGGRPIDARRVFEQAADEEPALEAAVKAQLATLRYEAEGCLLRPVRPATR